VIVYIVITFIIVILYFDKISIFSVPLETIMLKITSVTFRNSKRT